MDYFAPLLAHLFSQLLKDSNQSIPKYFLESALFFLHKKSSRSDPNNYRSIVVQNAYLKTLMSVLNHRISDWAETNNVLPLYQFGFRKHRSTMGAITLLHEAVKGATKPGGKKVYACFIDLRKAFDCICRKKLFEHLQKIGLPHRLCEIVLFAFENVNICIRSGSDLSSPFNTRKGTPQGDATSPTLFSLYLCDFEESLVPDGPLVF